MIGILAAIDRDYEVFLPWWYTHLRNHCSLPIAFVDFGMTKEGREMCKQWGEVIDLTSQRSTIEALECSTEVKQHWGKIFLGDHALMRPHYHIKPFAMLASPFNRTLFLDIDCQVVRPLDELFEMPEGLSIAPESKQWHDLLAHHEHRFDCEQIYNTGVILFNRAEPLIRSWAEATSKEGHLFVGDQELFSRVIYRQKACVQPLDSTWNWNINWGEKSDAHIIHFVGRHHKKNLFRQLTQN